MVDEMERSQRKYKPFFVANTEDHSYEDRCRRMSSPDEYVDNFEIQALSDLHNRNFVIYDVDRVSVSHIHCEGGSACGPPIVFRLSKSKNKNSEACHYELAVDNSERNWERFYSSYYTSVFTQAAGDYFKLDESEYSDCDDDDDDDYVEEDRNECGRKGRKRKRKAAGSGPSAPEKTATGSRKKNAKSRKKNAKSRKYPPDHKPSTVSELFAAASDDCHL